MITLSGKIDIKLTKIEVLHNIYFYSKMTSIHINNLVYNKRYCIETQKNIVNAIFMGSYNDKHLYFSEFKCYNRKIKHGIFVLYIHNNFKYYDYNNVEEIREKSKRARQQMEQRSLNMILKRLVNEEFQW